MSKKEQAIFKKACDDYQKACAIFNNHSFEECLNILQSDKHKFDITNQNEEIIDFNFGACCLTINNQDGVGIVCHTSIEVWDDKNCAYLGTFTISECKEKAGI